MDTSPDPVPARPAGTGKPRLLIFIVAYNAQTTIEKVLRRIPASLTETYAVEVLVIDDSSRDETFVAAETSVRRAPLPFPVHVLRNPVNQGYGGNQKLGFSYAIREGFDIVALVHGDGQYAPECLPELAEPLRRGEADAVFGSRMMTRGAALRGGMPLYKFVGNKILTWFQNRTLRTRLSEFHSGYRLYSVATLARIPFHLNSQVFHFDTQIIIQLVIARRRILEIPIPTYYGDEICHVDGLRYAWDVFVATLRARFQEYGLFYDRAYDCAPADGDGPYAAKLGFDSTHTAAVARVRPGERVLDLGGGNAVMARALAGKGCTVVGVDRVRPADDGAFAAFHVRDLNDPLPGEFFDGVGRVLLLDVIEHLADPEAFVDRLRNERHIAPGTVLTASTGNVAFLLTRLSLAGGMFNYGKRGILDRTHTRLFTIATFRRLFEQAGFEVTGVETVPAPFALVFGDGFFGRLLAAANRLGLRLLPGLFAYQVVLDARRRPTVDELLGDAHAHSAERRAAIGTEPARIP
jgi:glycosyltransferase involved in cell wall biosynthesis